MATVTIDINFKVPREIIREAVEEGALASALYIKQKADARAPIGSVRRPVYRSGKYKGKAWTGRNPGRLKRSGKAYKSKFEGGGAVVQYGSFLAYYSFMRHWGTIKVKANKFLVEAAEAAQDNIEREIAGRIMEKLK